jgi:hypothetical protein
MIEALIDGLTESRHKVDFSFLLPRDPPDPYDRVLERGFDAVPALIAHLDDRRLTRGAQLLGFNNAWGLYTYRVGDQCQSILDGMSGGETKVDAEDPTPAELRKKATVWFDSVQKLGEERWAVDNAIPEGSVLLNEFALRVVRAKYPRHLPRLYRAVLNDRPRLNEKVIAAEVAASSLDRETRLALLREGARHRSREHTLAAVAALERVDRVEFRRALREALDRFAKTGDGVWGEEFQLVVQSGDTDCWAALTRAIQTFSPVECRMYLISWVFDSEQEDRFRRARPHTLRLLVELLPDRTACDTKARKAFPYAGYQKIAVGDYAAVALADYLDIEVPWNPNRTASEWAEIREKVRTTAEKELGDGK